MKDALWFGWMNMFNQFRLKKLLVTFVCICSFAGLFCYTLLQRSFGSAGRPDLSVNGVVALTGYLSISQHQLNSKTIQVKDLQTRENLTKAVLSESKEQKMFSRLTSWEELEKYTVPKPSDNKIRRKYKNNDEFDEKFLRNDERSIERIVNGLASDSKSELPFVFRKVGVLKKRFPNVIIIGVKKGGTRALLEMIKLHPQVCTCGPEVHYFDRYYNNNLEWYRDKMPLCYENELVLEKTPSYFVTRGVAKDIYEYSKVLNRTLKLMVIVRDPTRRAISDYTQTHSKSINASFKRSFEESVITYGEDGTPYVKTQWNAIKIGVYSKHLKRWLKFFDRKQILVVSGDNLVKKPYEELLRVESFLELPSFIKPEHFVYNRTKGFYCFNKGIREFGANPNAATVTCLSSSKGRTHIFVSNKTEKLMQNYFRPFNEELYELIGRDLGWP